MTQLSNVLITNNSMYYQNKLSVIKTSDNCVFSKADWCAIDFPKKRTDEFVLFAFLLFTVNKSNSSVCFWENLGLANLLFDSI